MTITVRDLREILVEMEDETKVYVSMCKYHTVGRRTEG